MSAEQQEHAKTEKMPTVVRFFGYWTGIVPELAELHFKSFLCCHPHSHYDLWLDQDTESSVCGALEWILEHPRIHVRSISLSGLIRTHIPYSEQLFRRNTPLRWIMRWLHQTGLFVGLDQRTCASPIFGTIYRHSSPLYVSELRDPTYRADLARCLLPVQEYAGRSCYVDLDVCFLKNVLPLCNEAGFVYRWDTLGFGNNAIIHSPHPALSQQVLSKGIEVGSFRPCLLFSDDICRELGVNIYTADLFDPLWNKRSIMSGQGDLFFQDSEYTGEILDELANGGYFAVHWHNRWRIKVEKQSPYDRLMLFYNVHETEWPRNKKSSGGIL